MVRHIKIKSLTCIPNKLFDGTPTQGNNKMALEAHSIMSMGTACQFEQRAIAIRQQKTTYGAMCSQAVEIAVDRGKNDTLIASA